MWPARRCGRLIRSGALAHRRLHQHERDAASIVVTALVRFARCVKPQLRLPSSYAGIFMRLVVSQPQARGGRRVRCYKHGNQSGARRVPNAMARYPAPIYYRHKQCAVECIRAARDAGSRRRAETRPIFRLSKSREEKCWRTTVNKRKSRSVQCVCSPARMAIAKPPRAVSLRHAV